MKMDKQFPLYGFAAHKGRKGKNASLFLVVTGKAFQQCETPIEIPLRGRLLGKPSKKTSGCWCEAHPSRKPSGRGVGFAAGYGTAAHQAGVACWSCAKDRTNIA